MKRPPRIGLISSDPCDSLGGLPGSIQNFELVDQLPAISVSHLCSGPGVAAFSISSIIFCISGLGPFFASVAGCFFDWANACVANNNVTRQISLCMALLLGKWRASCR